MFFRIKRNANHYNRNPGTLQPQRSNCSGVRMLLVARITINEMNNPTVAVVCIQEYPLLTYGGAPFT
jgi:hypothetical protein